MLLFYIFVFLLGLCVGSFLNVLVLRIPQKKKINGRSHCPKCKKKLRWYELVPVFSFLFLRGKCLYCKKPISWQYPLVELSTGIFFVLTFWQLLLKANLIMNLFFLVDFLFWIFFVSVFIVIFVSDIKYYIVPDKVIFPAIVFAFLYQVFKIFEAKTSASFFNFFMLKPIFYALFSGFGAALFFFVLVVFTRGKGMGLGDVKIAALMGLLLSSPNIFVALLLSFFSGSMVGFILIMAKKKNLKSEVPFGCFLAPATFIAFFWGSQIISWYFGLIT